MIISGTQPVYDVTDVQNKKEAVKDEEARKAEETSARIKNENREEVQQKKPAPLPQEEKKGKNIDVTA